MVPNNTGPTKKPTKPIPETIEMAREVSISLFLPAILYISGTITESPKPKIPKPKTLKYKLEVIMKK